MEIWIRSRCWDCFSVETTCTICDNKGVIEKWIPIEELVRDLERIQMNFTVPSEQLPLIENINLPPNVNI